MAQTPIGSAPTSAPNLDNIQGDVVLGLMKRVELFTFFDIVDVKAFKQHLKHDIAPFITSTNDVLKDQQKASQARSKPNTPRVWLPIVQTNISFTFQGLTTLGLVAADLPAPATSAFGLGQAKDAVANLGDPVDSSGKLTTWSKEFLNNTIHGVFLITGPSSKLVDERFHTLKHKLGDSIKFLFELEGRVRPGSEAGHEHFGFLDGVSVPAVQGINDKSAHPGEDIVPAGNILCGRATPNTFPAWATDGSFLSFRQLEQFVPEFHLQSAQLAQGLQTKIPGITADFLESRMVGRWPSGAPLDLSPLKDDPVLGPDASKNNNFDYSDDAQEIKCPYAAHVRKTNPRNGSPIPREGGILPRLMVRQGIPYGPEVDVYERKHNKTVHNRGLCFVAYQSSVEEQFQFVQKSWANNATFPPNAANLKTPGTDPIIGQAVNGETTGFSVQNIEPIAGANVDPTNVTTIKSFVHPKGGEYFFTPPINALTGFLSQ